MQPLRPDGQNAYCVPGCCVRRFEIAEIKRAGWMRFEAQVRETVGREELRRALDGILDLERLLSRVDSGKRPTPAMSWPWLLH